MNYLVIGAGGTGGCIAAYLKQGGADVSLIARSEHLKAIKEKGLTIIKSDGKRLNFKVDAFTGEEFTGKADVIFVCVKWYDIDSVVPLIKKAAHGNTLVIPVLNIYTAGEYLSLRLPELTVADGCIYIASSISSPGEITMNGEIFRIFFGFGKRSGSRDTAMKVEKQLLDCGISAKFSDNIRRDALEKFSFVSSMAACGLFYGCNADRMQKDGKEREMFVSLVREIIILSENQGISFDVDLVEKNLKIMDDLSPDASTSMQRDIEKGKRSEIVGLIHSVAGISKERSLGLHNFERISDEFSYLK